MISEVITVAYTVERLNAERLHDVEKLHAAVYKRQPAPGSFLKKYNTAFTTVEHIGFVAYNNDGIPVGFYGVIPCFIQIGNRKVLSAQSADTMTHPEYRFKGLFVDLSNRTFQLCRDNGIQLLFGFPNQNSLPGAINKLGWTMTERMDCFIISTGIPKWIKAANKLPQLKKLLERYSEKRLQKYRANLPGIANSSIIYGFAGVDRDDAYYRYKTYTRTHVIKLGESILWVKLNSELLIGDILLGPVNFDDMICKLKKLARKLGISSIQFHTSPGSPLHKLFSERFKAVPSFPVLFKCFGDGLPIEEIKFTSADIDTF